MIILKFILLCELDSSGSGYFSKAGYFERGNELSGFIKAENFLTS
jgi:hypothetical protein